ncbi:unnamed protein product, partial [Durusdinium trenchii]
PLPGEEQILWAIQDVDQPETRQLLPDWVAMPLVTQLLKWTSDKAQWDAKIAARQNGKLPPAMNRKYQAWQDQHQEKRMLYNKAKQILLTPEAHTDLDALKKIRKQLFLVTLKFADDISQIRLETSNGASRQLVALRGQPCQSPPPAPDFLLANQIPMGDLKDFSMQNAEEEAPSGAEDQELDMLLSEDQLRAMEDDGVPEEQEHPNVQKVSEFSATDLMEIMATSDDEAVLSAPKHSRVRCFMHRPAYQKLARHGLVEVPTTVPGVCIGCHSTHRQWQAFYPGVRTGLSFSWGGLTLRTEEEALLKTIKGLLTAFVQQYPREELWHLGFIKAL